jgi:hypothetical protein
MNSLGLDGKHGSGIQDDTQLILNDLSESQLISFLDSLEALSDLRVLREWLELLEQAEIRKPVLSPDALSDEVGKLGVCLMNESSRGDTWNNNTYQLAVPMRDETCRAYHW